MHFKKLLMESVWVDVYAALEKHYKEYDIDSYKKVYIQLLSMIPSSYDSDMTIILRNVNSLHDEDETYFDISGKDQHGQILALDFTPWDQWLGFNVSDEDIKTYGKSDFIAHCLWEMTFHGTEKERDEKSSALLQRVDDLKDGEKYKDTCFFCEGTKKIFDEDCTICDENGQINMIRPKRSKS